MSKKTTGEHTCRKVNTLEAAEADGADEGDVEFDGLGEFRSRFMTLLGGPLRHLPAQLAAAVLNARRMPTHIQWAELQALVTGHDVLRLEKYW